MTHVAKVIKFEHLERSSKKDMATIIRLNLQIYFFAIFFIVLIFGNLAYIFEYKHPHFANIPLSMLWVLESLSGSSISMTVPETYPGIIIFMIVKFFSFILLGFLIYIMGNIIFYVLLGKKTHQSINYKL